MGEEKNDKGKITSLAVSEKAAKKVRVKAAKESKGVREVLEEIINKAIPNGND